MFERTRRQLAERIGKIKTWKRVVLPLEFCFQAVLACTNIWVLEQQACGRGFDFGCGFFLLTVGSFLLTVELSYLQRTILAF